MQPHKKILSTLLCILIVSKITACASVLPYSQISYEQATQALHNAKAPSERIQAIKAIRKSASNDKTFIKSIDSILSLESDLTAILDRDRFKLGSIAGALIDKNLGNFTANYAMELFFHAVGDYEESQRYKAIRLDITKVIEATGTGRVNQPYKVFSPSEAKSLLLSKNYIILGGAFLLSQAPSPTLVFNVKKHENAKAQNYYFNLPTLFQIYLSQYQQKNSPSALIAFLQYLEEKTQDRAAKTTLSIYTVYNRTFVTESPESFLGEEAKKGNIFATLAFTNMLISQSINLSQEQRSELLHFVEKIYQNNIEKGASEAEYRLALLYLAYINEFTDSLSKAKTILEGLANDKTDPDPRALATLGSIYTTGSRDINNTISADFNLALDYFQRASELNHPQAQIEFARITLLLPDYKSRFTQKTYDNLQKLAEQNKEDAMLLFAHAHIRHPHLTKSKTPYKDAQKWLIATSKQTKDTDILNEIAWILSTAHIPSLRNPAEALKIIQKLLDDGKSNTNISNNPAYIDTLAAALGANNQFEDAVKVQERAVNLAQQHDDEELIAILEKHLALLKKGRPIIEDFTL